MTILEQEGEISVYLGNRYIGKVFNGWQPIETAPKDGAWVLLCGGNDFGDDPVGPCVVAFWGHGDWSYAFWDSDWRSSYLSPTHWMPLPELPRKE